MGLHRRFVYVALILLIAALLAWRNLQEPSQEMASLGGGTMGTTYSITVPLNHAGAPLADAIEQRLDEIDRIFSTWRDDSDISRFNASRSTDWFASPEELASVVAESIRIHELTGGAFDITLGPVIERWGFGREDVTTPPSDEELAVLMASVGTRFLDSRASPPAIRKQRPDIAINLSGIAKGWAVDAIAMLLMERGIEHFMVEIGGEVRTRGGNGGKPWRIAIARPQPGEPQAQTLLEIGTAAIATSGGYHNSIELLEQQYIHIIDPARGRPVKSQTASVTVIDEASTMTADALATALIVMPAENAMRFADSNGIAAHIMLLDEDGRLTARSSQAFLAYLEREQQ
jgi:thiamine biosynthesis lipoprotein